MWRAAAAAVATAAAAFPALSPCNVLDRVGCDLPNQPICDDGDYGGGGGGGSSKAGGIDSGVLLVGVTYVMYGNCETLPPHRVRSHDRAPEPALCTDCVQFPTAPPRAA
eukprot:COSAG01_NODE_36069_length_521_cov_7.238771_1_plen_109_part_00